jgi:hypothetical protein
MFKFDATNNTYAKSTLLEYGEAGLPSRGECYNPFKVKYIDALLYVADDRDRVSVHRFSGDELEFVKQYQKPRDYNEGDTDISDFAIEENAIWYLSQGMKKIYGADAETHHIIGEYGMFQYLASPQEDVLVNRFQEPVSFEIDDNGDFIVCDIGANCIVKIYRRETRKVKYEMPINVKEYEFKSLDVNENGEVDIPINDKAQDLILIFKPANIEDIDNGTCVKI